MVAIALLLFLAWQEQAGTLDAFELMADGNISGVKSRAYCGIYAAYGATSAVLRKSGQKPFVAFSELLSNEYVSSYSGSSTQDLLDAIEKLGCNGKAYQCLSLRSLEGARNPMILHVSGRGALGTFQHWILFLGIDSENALVRDGEGGDYLMPLSELLSRWDGKAIAVFPKSDAPPRFHSWEIVANCILLSGVGFIVLTVRLVSSNKSFKWQSLAFLSLVGIALGYCFAINPKVRIESSLARSVKIHTIPSSIRSLSYEDLLSRATTSDSTIVDCRYRIDYDYGCIANAISIPVDISQSKLLAITRSLPKQSSIVLYCQSRGCGFSNIIAVELAKLGFTDLSIYRNGYAEWEAKSK